MPRLNHLLLLAILLLITAFSVWIFLGGEKPMPAPSAITDKTNTPVPASPTPRHQMTGVTYSTTLDGNALFSLQADRIELRKKRIGFLRIGLMHEAAITNGIINIHATDETVLSSSNEADRNGKGRQLLSEEIRHSLLPPMPAKRIVTVACRPATLIIHHGDGTTIEITSRQALIGNTDNSILFTGNATARHDNRTLTAEQLYFSLKNKMLQARGGARLHMEDKIVENKTLTVDFSLNMHTEQTLSR